MQLKTQESLARAPLGKKSDYVNTYSPDLLFPIPRQIKRNEIGISDELPFKGVDFWTGFELSWLNKKGKPVVAVAEFLIPCESTFLIESKSFKLYLNSFNNSQFESVGEVKSTMQKDLSNVAGADVGVTLFSLEDAARTFGNLKGICLDDLDIECTEYMPRPDYLSISTSIVEESFHTHLLKSNCLVTGQPDWGSLEVTYRGQTIDRAGLLKYIVSLRDHNEFHEQCVERIFLDIQKKCSPEWLTVYARYTRRGGLDINPFRTNCPTAQFPDNLRLVRQ